MAKRVIVVGSSGGIGKACVNILQNGPYEVIGLDLKNAVPPLDSFLCVDLSSTSMTEKAIEEMMSETVGPIDLVFCAAVQHIDSLETFCLKNWEETFAVNVRSFLHIVSLLFEKERLGNIVAISSVHASATSRGLMAYAASKGALSSLVRSLALELAPRGIRVNSIAPGAVETTMLAAGFERSENPHKARETLLQRTPLKRIALPADIAEMVLFLLDERKSSMITGGEFFCDGGVMAQLSSEGR